MRADIGRWVLSCGAVLFICGAVLLSCGAVLLMGGVAAAAAPQGSPADLTEPLTPPAVPDVRVRLENHAAKPFTYQIGRPRGQAWSKDYTIPAGSVHEFAVKITSTNKWVLPTSHGAPGLTVRFAESGGWMMHKLMPPSGTEKKFYAYVVNEKGFGELVEGRVGVPVTSFTKPGEEAERINQLQANHCFHKQ